MTKKKSLSFETFHKFQQLKEYSGELHKSLKSIDLPEYFGSENFISKRGTTIPDLENKIDAFGNCCKNMTYGVNPENWEDYQVLEKMSCQLPFCAVCASSKRNSLLMQYHPMFKTFDKIKDLHFYMVTLSLGNNKDLSNGYNELRESFEAFNKMGQSRGNDSFSGGEMSKNIGYVMSIEYTYNPEMDNYNVHAHIIMVCNSRLDYRVYDKNSRYNQELKKFIKGDRPVLSDVSEIFLFNKFGFQLPTLKRFKKDREKYLELYKFLYKNRADKEYNFLYSYYSEMLPKSEMMKYAIKFVDVDGKKMAVSKISEEWYRATKGKGITIDVREIKNSGSVRTERGYKKIESLSDHLVEVLKYETKLNEMPDNLVLKAYIELEGTRRISRGGIFTNYSRYSELWGKILQDNDLEDYYTYQLNKYSYGVDKEKIEIIPFVYGDSRVMVPHCDIDSFQYEYDIRTDKEFISDKMVEINNYQTLWKSHFDAYNDGRISARDFISYKSKARDCLKDKISELSNKYRNAKFSIEGEEDRNKKRSEEAKKEEERLKEYNRWHKSKQTKLL